MKADVNSLIAEPIFLVGAERSGTTVLRLMLGHHPQIAWCQEFEYAVHRMGDRGSFPELEEYYEWLSVNRVFQATGFKIDQSLNYPQLINSFLVQKRELEGKPLVGATVHHHFDRLLNIWSDARFIHLIRDPRDVARSWIGMGWAGNVWTGVDGWIVAEKLWEDLKVKIPPEKRLEVVYEQLISDSTRVLTEICNFLGVNYEPQMLSYADKTTYELPDPKLIYQWKKKSSEYEIRLVESKAAELMPQRGYELSGLPMLNLNPITIFQLKLQDWWARVQFRFKRYGMNLFICDYISRNFGFKQWQKDIRLKLNIIDTAYLK